MNGRELYFTASFSPPMLIFLTTLPAVLSSIFRSRGVLQLENLALRHQIGVLRRSARKRPKLTPGDRLLWVLLSHIWRDWRSALAIVKPETVVAWHRAGFRLFWTWKLRHGQTGRPTVSRKIRDLIRKMCRENPGWGAPRIHGELLKLGIDIGESSVSKYMVRSRRPPSQTWRTFLENHTKQLVSVLSTPRSPWQRAYVERVIGSIRRECLDHVIVFHETSLRRILGSYFDYYHRSRTHLSLSKDSPEPRSVQPPEVGAVVAVSQVGGLHHRYERRAA
jgi:hypothetical protein